MAGKEIYSIRPAGRHILTIGRDLIQNQYAAIVELVKNAYDADSPDVNITFEAMKSGKGLTVTIEDHGHGMSRDTVINKWLVPSTDDKLIRQDSPKGRTMQGCKGIGRYAASILGEDIHLQTITAEGEKTELYIEWSKFKKAKYLDDVEISVKTSFTNQSSGTTLIITGSSEHLSEWDEMQRQKLQYELKKLVTPANQEISRKSNVNSFSITLNFTGFKKGKENDVSVAITPFPILKLYDYRISGILNADGKGNLFYKNQKARNTSEEKIAFDLSAPTGCGKLEFDIRVYDREKEAIDQLIKRGLKDDHDNYVDKLEARRLLNESNGIGVYRNGFRIRPLGDPDFDWLELNRRRIQNPSMRIGSNQVIGHVQIQSEKKSELEEKSARDGLRENKAYTRLKDISSHIIAELEERRFQYRRSAGLSRTTLKVERELEKIFEFENMKKSVRSKLVKSGVKKTTADEVIEIIARKEEENNRIAEEIRQAVAIYQGQATLGKIINVILHEGRRPLNYFKNQIPNLTFWANKLKEKYDAGVLEKLVPIADGLGVNASVFVKLFSRLDPLAAGKRGSKKEFDVLHALKVSFQVFENEFIEKGIEVKINCSDNVRFIGWEEDMYVILTNLIDNSVFWMLEKKSTKKIIEVTVVSKKDKIAHIDYRDSGPGIEANLIESEVIFEPEFTTKPGGGTGLGLAIAGEAAARNGLELKAFASDTGAYFRLQPNGE